MTAGPALVIGASGLVGSALLDHLGAEATGTYRSRPRPGLRHLDAEDPDAVSQLMHELCPRVIYFPAANPNVEWCEKHPAEAYRENLAPLRATLAAAPGIPVVAYSSDYVFDGAATSYGESDDTAPLNVYGRIKAELEAIVTAAGGAIVRTTGVFGPEPAPGKNFVLRLVASLRRGEPARVPDDQIANPTWAPDLAAASVAIATVGGGGIWHVAGPEDLSRSDFARLVAAVFGLDGALVVPVRTAELGQAARRPLHGVLRRDRYRERFGTEPVRSPVEGLIELRQLDP